MGLHIVLRHALALEVRDAKAALGARFALSAAFETTSSPHRSPAARLSLGVHDAEVALGKASPCSAALRYQDAAAAA